MFSTIKLERTALLLTSLIAILSPSLSAVALANQTCYYPDGSIAQGDKPCGNGTDVACCGSGGICLSNGLCMDVAQPNTLARSSCTDKSWTSGNCPNYCLQGESASRFITSAPHEKLLYTNLDFITQRRVSTKVAVRLFSFHISTASASTAVTTWTRVITHPSALITYRLSKFRTRALSQVLRFCQTTPLSQMPRPQRMLRQRMLRAPQKITLTVTTIPSSE